MKTNYQTPQIEVIEMRNYLESFCISGQEYTGKQTGFDDGSD